MFGLLGGWRFSNDGNLTTCLLFEFRFGNLLILMVCEPYIDSQPYTLLLYYWIEYKSSTYDKCCSPLSLMWLAGCVCERTRFSGRFDDGFISSCRCCFFISRQIVLLHVRLYRLTFIPFCITKSVDRVRFWPIGNDWQLLLLIFTFAHWIGTMQSCLCVCGC